MILLSVSERILFFVCGLGVLQAILLAVLVYFHPKSDRTVNKFLALYILCTTIIMSFPFIIQLLSWQNSFFIQPLPLLGGPLLYLYLRSFKETITLRKAFPHFLPFLLFLFPTYLNVSLGAEKYPHEKNIPPELLHSPATIILQYTKPIQQIIYYFLSLRTLKTYQHSIKQLYSETSRIDLNWARFLVNGYLVLICAFIFIFPVMLFYPEHFNVLLLTNMAIATPYIYAATYKGITQPTIWQLDPGINKSSIEEEMHHAEEIEIQTAQEKPKTAKPGLSPDKTTEIVKKLLYQMEKEKIYMETELTLKQLADKIEVPTYQLSQAINEGMNKNFYDLVNGYRVEEAKRLLTDPKNLNYTILSVGFEAGFNSKTTFNTVFKKFTGLTPTEYREKKKAGAYAGIAE